ncbi:hypothetical protein [Budvicia diplopodorum]|uniref:hypothetical protein n=1 Tax=Budvicia diplopodorum TaxID=1119056 RepID=UPI00135AF6B6|nr:hypothetical protein [Budvicia diplopodorum]
MKRLILLAIISFSLAGCASWQMTSESVKAMTNDELCTRLGSAVETGNAQAVTLLLDEYKLRYDSIDEGRCAVLERTGKQSVRPPVYYYNHYPFYGYGY